MRARFAFVAQSKKRFPLTGLALVGKANRLSVDHSGAAKNAARSTENIATSAQTSLQQLTARDSVWVGESLGKRAGDQIQLVINDRPGTYTVRGTFPDGDGNESAIVMDLAAAQFALNRAGRVDRIYLRIPLDAAN